MTLEDQIIDLKQKIADWERGILFIKQAESLRSKRMRILAARGPNAQNIAAELSIQISALNDQADALGIPNVRLIDVIFLLDRMKSSLVRLEDRLRTQIASQPKEPPPEPISITIDGPESLELEQFATFIGIIDGGLDPLKYEWRVDGKVVSDSFSIFVNFIKSGIHIISLKVTDAVNQIKTVSLPITVFASPPVESVEPIPEEQKEGLSLDTKVGIALAGVAVVIGVVFGAVLAQKPK